MKKLSFSLFMFAFMSVSSIFANTQSAYQVAGDTILPPVFLIGEYENQYNEIVENYETLLFTVCDFDMDTAFSKWQSLLMDMSSFAKENEVDLDGVKIWLNVFLEKDGQISHLAYYLKPMSKNIDDALLKALLKEFIKNYKLPLTSVDKYSHYGTASFPVHPIKKKPNPNPSSDGGSQLSTGQY